jgi:GAF domain-containing protein
MSATPDSTLVNPEQIIAELQRQLAECRAERDEALAERDKTQRRLGERTAERDEALEQQTATAEVLGVINSSPGDLAPVFDAILDKAHRLCGAAFGSLGIFEGERWRAVVQRGYREPLASVLRQGVRVSDNPLLQELIDGTPRVHVGDLRKLDLPIARANVAAGIHTLLVVALRKDDALLGTISIARREVRPFSDKEIGLLENFAAQTVIAMENARLLTETREALEQQTATAEVLQVINSSPGDLAPVFDAILDKALRLCEATHGHIWRVEGQYAHAVALRGDARFIASMRQESPTDLLSGRPLTRIARGEYVVNIPDATEEDIYRANRAYREFIDASGIRSGLMVALRKDEALLGAIVVHRKEVLPFTDRQIALLQNFAAQAVIATENARLLTETREALEQQTATAEVLQVINSSPGNLAPVFDAILEKAHSLCGAAKGALVTYNGEHFRAIATRGLSEPSAELLSAPQNNPPGSPPDRMLCGECLIHIPDFRTLDLPIPRALVQFDDVRTALFTPLRKDGVLLGYITAYRLEVHPFSDKQIALLQNFASQAVIAMENARLLTETREALAQQTATAEVLQVINSSPGDLAPVFDAMLEKGVRLAGAAFGILCTFDGECFRMAAMRGVPARYAGFLKQTPLTFATGSGPAAVLAGQRFHTVADFRADELTLSGDPQRRALVELGGARSGAAVPLIKEGVLVGIYLVFRPEVRPFTEKQIALLENFAAQAVIAMENARLLTETREALEQQTATAEVLQVINSSPGDLAPVFQAIVEKAHTLCGAVCGSLQLWDGEKFRGLAMRGFPEPMVEALRQGYSPGPNHPCRELIDGGRIAHCADMAAVDDPVTRVGAKLSGIRTVAYVALRRDDALLGQIVAGRLEVRPFTDAELALLENFAAQAVIAIENARLIIETREALEQQQAIAEVLQVINSSPGDLTPVFDAILEKAHSLCGIASGSLELYDGENFRSVAERGLPKAFADMLREGYPASDNPVTRPLIEGDRFTHIADLAETDYTVTQSAAELLSARTLLCIPLLRENLLLGMIACARQEVRLFSEKEIALLESFAAQAVIAMDNARLLNEIRQRQAELRVTFDNMGDGVAMFDGELRLAAWNLNFQRILDVPDDLLAERPSYSDYIRFLARRGEFGNADIEAELSRRLEGLGQELRFEHTRPDGRVIEVRRNAVPGGGFVIIYSDVTERKRAEEEIRTARDTAERALQELQTAQASLVHAQKMAALGQLTAGIAHEIKNPLNFVNNFAELSGELLLELKETTAPAVATLGDDERAAVDEVVEILRGNLDKIAEHGKRADGIVKSMLEHSRGVSGERRLVDLNVLIEEALNLAYHGARAQDASFNITLERELDRGLAPMELAPKEMTRVFLNLFGNGFYAANKRLRDGAGPEFRPMLRVATRDLGDAVEVRVRDNGTGIAPEIRDKLFQPFVTTKPTGEGTGLGLSIAWDIVTQQHGGTIEVDSRVGEFTEFTIRLPPAYGATIAEAAA